MTNDRYRALRLVGIALATAFVLPWGEALAKDEAPQPPIWLAVTRPMFVEALGPLARKRGQEGFRVVVSTEPVAKALAGLGRRPETILLVGDDQRDAKDEPWRVPTQWRPFYRWRSSQAAQFAADPLWGDLDGDLLPDVPVGRIPARTVPQVRDVVAKTLAYEARSPTPADLSLPIWAGTAGLGETLNSMATNMLLNTVQADAPAWCEPWFLTGHAGHVLCAWPRDHVSLFNERYLRGGAFAGLIGHGSIRGFHSMDSGDEWIGYTGPGAAAALAKGDPGPPMVILTCHAGNFAHSSDCLAESLLHLPAGPVAVIAATIESHPLTNYYSSICLLREMDREHQRMGAMWLAAQRRMLRLRNFLVERTLRDVEGKLDDSINVSHLRRDQVLMYALLGDPATHLRLPTRLHGKVSPRASGWHWLVHKPKGATKLLVGLRVAEPELPPARVNPTREQSLEDFRAANAAHAFRPLAERAADQPWEGTAPRPGILRFVALGNGRIYAAAVRLQPPATQPARPAPEASR